jgi:hypothetical protein
MSAPIFAAEEKPKTNYPLILGLCAAVGGAYYLFMHVPRNRTLKLSGPDSRINGDYELSEDVTTARKHLDAANLGHPNGEWSTQVWKHTSKQTYIYDHNVTDGNHTWCIGPWNSSDGGAIMTGRFAYIYVSKKIVDTQVAKYKKSQTWVDLGRTVNPLKSWDVMQFGWFHNGWDWTAEARKGTGTIKMNA